MHVHHHALLNSKTKRYCLYIDVKNRKSGLVTSYTLINVFKKLSNDKITIIVFHGYREVVSPGAEAVTVASFVR